jgi:hypothetical protein
VYGDGILGAVGYKGNMAITPDRESPGDWKAIFRVQLRCYNCNVNVFYKSDSEASSN